MPETLEINDGSQYIKVATTASTPAAAAALAAAKQDVKNNYYKSTLAWGLGATGHVAGILLAIKRKSGFWGGVGWFFLLGFAGSATGYVIGSVLDGKPKEEKVTE